MIWKQQITVTTRCVKTCRPCHAQDNVHPSAAEEEWATDLSVCTNRGRLTQVSSCNLCCYLPSEQRFTMVRLRALQFVIALRYAVANWLRHYATSRKVAGSRPDKVNFCNSPNPSGRIRPWGSLSL
jgi:hypothetical protein